MDISFTKAGAHFQILTQSLTPEVLQQRYLDTMQSIGKNDNLIVVPDDFNGILNMGK